jgi:hypothetical protein
MISDLEQKKAEVSKLQEKIKLLALRSASAAFADLPKQTMLAVLEHLGACDVLATAQVSSRMHQIVQDAGDALWRTIAQSAFPALLPLHEKMHAPPPFRLLMKQQVQQRETPTKPKVPALADILFSFSIVEKPRAGGGPSIRHTVAFSAAEATTVPPTPRPKYTMPHRYAYDGALRYDMPDSADIEHALPAKDLEDMRAHFDEVPWDEEGHGQNEWGGRSLRFGRMELIICCQKTGAIRIVDCGTPEAHPFGQHRWALDTTVHTAHLGSDGNARVTAHTFADIDPTSGSGGGCSILLGQSSISVPDYHEGPPDYPEYAGWFPGGFGDQKDWLKHLFETTTVKSGQFCRMLRDR